jgi:DNA-binding SARP family transcriptional activator
MTVSELREELLPDWYDDWLLLERERLRQVRLHGLEALCVRLTHLGRYSQAIEAGLLAVEEEALRESSQRALIAAHVSEGNLAEAVRQYDRYAQLLQKELGIAPGAQIRALVAPCR